MSLAHRRSRRFVIDPAYSATRVLPDPAGLSRFAEGGGPAWLYGGGDFEAFRMGLTRRRGFAECLNVFHPGLFDRHRHVLTMARTVELRRLPARMIVTIRHSGDLKLSLNGILALRAAATASPVARRVDLAPFLRRGENTLSAILARIDEPAALLIESSAFATDTGWTVSADGFRWDAPTRFPAVNRTAFPHQEELPTILLRGERLRDGTVDFGRELLGRVVVTSARLPRLRVGESLAEAANVDPRADEQAQDLERVGAGRFVSAGRLALRYARTTPSTRPPAVIACEASFHPARYRGAFACSDERLTRVWMASAYTLRLCMQDFLVDGIKRDRMPWVGDLYIALLADAYTVADAGIVRRSLTALFGDQPERSHFNGILDYTLYWIVCLDAHVRCFGDLAYARAQWPRLRELLATLSRQRDADGWLIAREGDWVFIDWAPMDKTGAVAVVQLLYAMALASAARLAPLCGDAGAGARLAREATALRARCRLVFWDERQGGYVENLPASGGRARVLSRHGNIFALLSGTASARQRPRIAEVLRGTRAAPVGTPYQMFFESLALARLGEQRRMLDQLRAYWGGMLDLGATTFWEAHDPSLADDARYAFYGRPFAKSLCHAWSAGPAALLPAEILGVRPAADGWSRVTIAPRLGGLEWAAASVPTPHGEIEIEVDGGSQGKAGHVQALLPAGVEPAALPRGARPFRRGARRGVAFALSSRSP